MKKSEKTALTAALFAAALNMVPSGALDTLTKAYSAADSGKSTGYDPADDTPQTDYGPIYDPGETTPPAVYGPPWWFTTTATSAVTTAPATDPTPIRTTDLFQDVYGPPPDMNFTGDLTGDTRVDTFDMVEMRKRLISGDWSDYQTFDRADVNMDGAVNIADMVLLQKYLLGMISDYSEAGSDDPPMYGVYGPPPDLSASDN